MIQVYDVDCDIDSELLIKGITFNLGDGATTDMEFALADAYKLQASLDEVEGRTNKTKKTKKKGKKGKKKKSKGLSEADNAKLNSLLGI